METSFGRECVDSGTLRVVQRLGKCGQIVRHQGKGVNASKRHDFVDRLRTARFDLGRKPVCCIVFLSFYTQRCDGLGSDIAMANSQREGCVRMGSAETDGQNVRLIHERFQLVAEWADRYTTGLACQDGLRHAEHSCGQRFKPNGLEVSGSLHAFPCTSDFHDQSVEVVEAGIDGFTQLMIS